MGNKHYIETSPFLLPPFQEPDLSYIRMAQKVISECTEGLDCYIEFKYNPKNVKFELVNGKSENITDELAFLIKNKIKEATDLLQQNKL